MLFQVLAILVGLGVLIVAVVLYRESVMLRAMKSSVVATKALLLDTVDFTGNVVVSPVQMAREDYGKSSWNGPNSGYVGMSMMVYGSPVTSAAPAPARRSETVSDELREYNEYLERVREQYAVELKERQIDDLADSFDLQQAKAVRKLKEDSYNGRAYRACIKGNRKNSRISKASKRGNSASQRKKALEVALGCTPEQLEAEWEQQQVVMEIEFALGRNGVQWDDVAQLVRKAKELGINV